MWLALALGLFGAWGIADRWRTAADGERLLLLWVAVGSLELLIHDVGNERRFVFLIPALVALPAWCWPAAASAARSGGVTLPRRRLLLFSPSSSIAATSCSDRSRASPSSTRSTRTS